MQSSADVCPQSGESGSVSNDLTMYTWQTITTICVICVTFWILQRRRARGKGNSASNVGAEDHVKSKSGRKTLEAAIRTIGATECKAHEYDVFINHRGPDVKQTFVAHLDAALRRNGFRPFLDAKDVGKGRHVFTSIDKALKGSCVHVAIFSKRYAESKYCLNELCDMLKSGKTILPVFYHVEPEDLRRIEKGLFKEGFEKHVKRGRVEEIEKWKKGLVEIADYRGIRLDEVNGNEEQLIRSILVDVRQLLPIDVLQGKPRYGLAKSKQGVLKILMNVSVVGLVGMGGIGKTTLAEEVYNHFVSCKQFERYCFVRDVRSSTSTQLRHQLLRDLGHGSDLQSMSAEEYKRTMDVAMCQRVVVIVDDIDHPKQLEALLPEIQRLQGGSRVVITSRQRDVVIKAMKGASTHEVFEVPFLNETDARHLFNRHAFLSETPSEGFGDLAAKVADACGGHALSLETMGASLFDKKEPEDKGMWVEAVRALQENDEVFGKLRSTYDGLPSDGDRAMFQDIACMLIGTAREVAMRVWESCKSCSCGTSETPSLALRRLRDRSLVKVDEYGSLHMHDVLRDMGRYMMKKATRGPEEWSYVWDAATATKVVKCRKKNTRLRGIRLENIGDASWQELQRSFVSCEASELGGMDELHFLILDGCNVPDGFSNWPWELRWLRWRGFPGATLPSRLNLPSLVVLDLSISEKLIRLWEDGAQIQLPVLETLDLWGCKKLEELGEDVGESIPHVKRLVLRLCRKLRRLPESMGQLTNLEHLNLAHCFELVSLPDEIVEVVGLRQLILFGCKRLEQLPEQLGRLTNLERLDVVGCLKLRKLPAAMGGLKMLKSLEMSSCAVEDLPADIGLLSCLTEVSLSNCLRTVPETFRGHRALTSLYFCDEAVDLGDLGAFTALKVLTLINIRTVTTLPKSLGNLKWLIELNMEWCGELLIIEALPEGLVRLKLRGCCKLTKIPSLAGMRSLVALDVSGCSNLRHVDGLDGLECITRCHLEGSRVGVAYNNKWLERGPVKQVISWCGDTIPILLCDVLKEDNGDGMTLVMEAIVSSKAECIALVWCIIVEEISLMHVKVWRSGEPIFLEYIWEFMNEDNAIVLLFTWRKEHGVVQSLQYGDVVRFYIRKHSVLRLQGGGVCMVHREDEDLVMAMNSKVLSKMDSKHLESQFGQLALGDTSEYLDEDTDVL